MIRKVTIQNFKRFRQPTVFEFKPEGITFLAGGNNSGKSTLLQALAVWEFARAAIEINKGKPALNAGARHKGIGIGYDEFSPVALPDFRYLWSNLEARSAGGSETYNLSIRCEWDAADASSSLRHLEFSLALSFDRLFVKMTASNLTESDLCPRIAYLPPFAGIGAREERMSTAARRRWMGRGLAGAVLRNLLYDYWQQNYQAHQGIKNPSGRAPKAAKSHIRRTDSWEQLQQVLEEVFKMGLTVAQFNELYHTTINVTVWEGRLANKRFEKKKDCIEKDLMVEGSGFLQWLSVYVLALSKEVDVLLLDEPDAHLHPALQGHLVQKLGTLARENNKQVLLATHSTTILSETRLERIFRMEQLGYLGGEQDRVALFVGLGSQYAPRLDQLKRTKRLFLYEGPSDLDFLQIWADTLELRWPQNLICWKYTKDREARKILFDELRSEISQLEALSLQDRDDYPFSDTKADLTFDNLPQRDKSGMHYRRWRRRNIENYLLCPAAIARASGLSEEKVRNLLCDTHGVSVTPDFPKSDCVSVLAMVNGKEIMLTHERSVEKVLGVTRQQVAAAMTKDEIPEDVKTLLNDLVKMCRS